MEIVEVKRQCDEKSCYDCECTDEYKIIMSKENLKQYTENKMKQQILQNYIDNNNTIKLMLIDYKNDYNNYNDYNRIGALEQIILDTALDKMFVYQNYQKCVGLFNY